MKKETLQRIRKFIKDRDWGQFHSPSNLAKAISIEAAELLEEFLWDNENYNKQNSFLNLKTACNFRQRFL